MLPAAEKVSKIPRWCRPKPSSPDPLCISGIGSNPCRSLAAVTLPPIYTEDQLLGICEPPSLQQNALHVVWKAKAGRKQVDDSLNQSVSHTEFIKQQLKEVKKEIEKISRQLECPDTFLEFAGESDARDLTALVAKHNCRLQQNLLRAINKEEQLTNNLEKAQRHRWAAGATVNLFAVEIEDKVAPIIQAYETRKEFMLQKRALREKLLAQNAARFKTQVLQTASKTLQTSETAKSTKKRKVAQRILGAKIARKRIEHHLKITFQNRNEKKFSESCDKQLKQDKQQKHLSNLKKEITGQLEQLKSTNELRQNRLQKIARQKELIHQQFLQSGQNPYYVDHLLKIEEKRTQLHRTLLQKETERLTQLQREYEIVEKAKQAEEFRKKKWAKFWAQNLEMKKQAKLKEAKMLFQLETVTETETLTANLAAESYDESGNEPSVLLPSVVPAPVTATVIDSTSTDNYTQLTKPAKLGKLRRPSRKSRMSRGDSMLSVRKAVNILDPSSGEMREDLGESAYEEAGQKLLFLLKGDSEETDSFENKTTQRKSARGPRKSVKGRKSLKNRKSFKIMETFNEEYQDLNDTLEGVEESTGTEEFHGEGEEEDEEEEEGGVVKKKFSFKHAGWKIASQLLVLDAWADTGDGDKHITHTENSKPRHIPRLLKSGMHVKPVLKPASFRWMPESIKFTDFEVGKVYKKTLTVTNISTSRCKILLSELQNYPPPVQETQHDDKNPEEKKSHRSYKRFFAPTEPTVSDINDVLHYNTRISKTVSPGISSDICLTFTPLAQIDYRGYLVFEGSTETFKVLVECRKQRFEPETIPMKVVFPSVVAKTSSFFKVKITNNGALPGVLTKIEQAGPVITYFGEEYKITEVIASESQASSALLRSSRSAVLDLASKATSALQQSASNSSNSNSRGQQAKSKSSGRKKKPLKATQEQVNEIQSLLDQIVENVTSSVFCAYIKECNRSIGPHESRTMIIFFRPLSIDTFRTKFNLHFDNKAADMMTINVEGMSVENPVFVKPLASDLKICTLDRNYQQLMSVSTAARGAGKVTPKVPEELRPFVDIVPQKATVFARNPGRFTLKFHPSLQLLSPDNPASRYVDQDSKILDFPVDFHLKFPYNVETPISATVMAILTDPELVFEPPEVDMGLCSSVETVINTFSIFNISMLPQRIGFVGVPSCFAIHPNFGFTTLLPFEKRQFDILFSLPEGTMSGQHLYSLQCQTQQNRPYFFPVRVTAKSGYVQLSSTKMFFPVTAIGNVVFSSLSIFTHEKANVGNDKHRRTKFQFAIQPGYPITITPKAGYLDKNQKRVKLIIRYEAALNEIHVKEHLLELLKNEYVQDQAMIQRELEGINQTLEMEMVVGEDDLDPDFLRLVDSSRNSSEKLRGSNPLRKKQSKMKMTSRKSNTKTRTESKATISSKKKTSSLSKSRTGSLKRSSTEETVETVDNAGEYFLSEVYDALKRRRKELKKLLSVPFNPPNIEQIDIHSREFAKAKQDLMKTVSTKGHQYTIPCFVTFGDNMDILYLKVKAAVSSPSLIILENSEIVDFGNVIVGAKAYREIYICNVTSNPIAIKAEELNPSGPFLRCNALRKIPSENVFALKFRLKPTTVGETSETMKVNGGDSQFIFTLRGIGIAADFDITPNKKDLYIGSVVVGEFLSQKFEITNRCEGELQFTIQVTNQGGYEGFEEDLTEKAIILRFGSLKNENLQTQEILPIPAPPNTTTKDTEPTKPKKSMRIDGPKKRTSVEIEPDNAIIDPSLQGKRDSKLLNGTDRKSIPLGRTSLTSRKSVGAVERNEITRTSQNPMFTITRPAKDGEDKDKGALPTLNLNTNELVSFLQEQKKQFFFQSIPSTTVVPASSSATFSVYFVPAEGGRFFADFQIKLYEDVVHEFSIVGIGHNVSPERGETQL